MGEAFRRRGFSVVETGVGTDGGVDIVLDRAGERFFVQCQQWRALNVGVKTVRELYDVMAARDATGGFVRRRVSSPTKRPLSHGSPYPN
jgi:restriction system protein